MDSADLVAAIDRAAKLTGSDTALAKLCGVTQAAIWNARHRNRISSGLALKIESATAGEVNRSALRPDLWPLNAACTPAAGNKAPRGRAASPDPTPETSRRPARARAGAGR